MKIVTPQTASYEMELVEYRDGDAFFQYEQAAGSDIALVLPLSNWDEIGRPGTIRVTIERVP